jgi:hypothetical protein
MKTTIALVVVFLLAACSSPTTPSATPDLQATAKAALPTPTLPPLILVPVVPATSELVSVSGSGPGSSDPFTIADKSIVRVNWQQASTGKFVLKIVNNDPAQAGTPYGDVTFEVATGPSARASDYEFIAGQYTAKVVSADGPWKVWVEYVGPGK